jgi:hypothetical protein
MCRARRVDRCCGGTQRLRHDLAAEQPSTPRVSGSDAHIRVGSMRFETKEIDELDVSDPRCRHHRQRTRRPAIAAIDGIS